MQPFKVLFQNKLNVRDDKFFKTIGDKLHKYADYRFNRRNFDKGIAILPLCSSNAIYQQILVNVSKCCSSTLFSKVFSWK